MAYGNDRQYGRYDRDDYDSRGSGASFDKQEKQRLSAVANDAIKKSAAAMDNAEIGKTEKFLGFNVDSGLAAYLSSIYNIASDNIGRVLNDRVYNLTARVGEHLGMSRGSMPLKQTAAVTTFVVKAGLKSAADISKVTAAYSEQKKERQKLVHSIAPVLDDIKGRHSLGAFSRVSEGDNEVIYAHRQRLSKIAKSENSNRLIGMAMNVLPNVALDVTHFSKMWEGMTPDKIKTEAKKEAKKLSKHGTDDSSFGNLGRTFVQATTGQVADRITRTNELRLRKTLQPYSALEMILELEQQVESNPKASSFQVPKGFQGNSSPESYPLEEYLALVFIQHQRDMADLKDEHTQIREALHEDLSKAMAPVAKAIQSGSLSVMSLVRLVGERQIIKNKGRSVATPDEVTKLIKNSNTYVHTDLEEFYRNSPVPREEMKKLLDKLEGQERVIYLSLLPDAVKADLGVKKEEIKKVHDQAKQNKEKLADLVVAAHQESQGALKKEGLAGPEIEKIDTVYQAVKRGGVEALEGHTVSPTNPDGIEKIIANWAVPKIQQGKLMGTIASGHEKFTTITANLEKETGDASDSDGQEAAFTSREKMREQAGQHGGMDLN